MAYAFEKLPQTQDVRGEIASDGYLNDRNTDLDELEIGWHHGLTPKNAGGSDAASYADYHVHTLGWPRIGYGWVIEPKNVVDTPNGPRARIAWCNSPDKKSYHVGNSNDWSAGICVAGDYRTEHLDEPTLASMAELRAALEEDNIGKGDRGHNEFPDYAWKACPEYDYMAAIAYKPGSKNEPIGTNNDPVLRKGDNRSAVKKLQQSLLAAGYKLPEYGADGDFGSETKNAVLQFQKDQNITVDGIVGPETWEHLNKAISTDKNWKNKLAVVVADVMNVRHSPDMGDDAIAGRVKKDEAFTIIDKVVASNGSTELYKLKSGLYISAHEDYTELKKVPEPEPKDELVIVTYDDGLNVRDELSFNDSAVVGQVEKGEAFTIVGTHEVEGTPMFELKSGLFITAHEEYVKVR